MVKSAKELYAERQKRINDAIALKEPDRVPIAPLDNGWSLKYAGLSWIDGLYDPEKALKAEKKAVTELNWDAFMVSAAGPMFPGKAFDRLDLKQMIWPGAEKEENRVKVNGSYQFIEPGSRGKYDQMPAEDYDLFLDDPSDYIIRRWLPRIAKNLEPLKNISPLHLANSVYGFGPLFGNPDFIKVLKVMLEASEEYSKAMAPIAPYVMEMTQLGFPPLFMGMGWSPYDYLADFMRGTEGCMIDMFRRPEKLKEAIKKVTPYCIEWSLMTAMPFKDLCKVVFIPVHKGAGGFMSNEQYEEFWWPSMREVMMALIDEGFIPYLYSEGIYTERLPIIKDIPKGKAIYHIESDIFKAKKILGDTVCLTGGPTATMMNIGTPKQVEEYTKRLIDEVGQGGGFIMDVEVPLITARIENVEAMTKTVMEYGVY